jgi:hypothetical protein
VTGSIYWTGPKYEAIAAFIKQNKICAVTEEQSLIRRGLIIY